MKKYIGTSLRRGEPGSTRCLSAPLAVLKKSVPALTDELRSRNTLIDRLKVQLMKRQCRQCGRSSEKLDRANEQLAQEGGDTTNAARIRPSPQPGEEKVGSARGSPPTICRGKNAGMKR